MIAGMSARKFPDMVVDPEDNPREGGPSLADVRATLVEYLRCRRLTLVAATGRPRRRHFIGTGIAWAQDREDEAAARARLVPGTTSDDVACGLLVV
jgi:hypothetical protein